MAITEEAFLAAVQLNLVTMFDAVHTALHEYRDYPSITVFRPATAAGIRVDLIYRSLISAFDEEAHCGVIEVPNQNSRYFKIADDILLWFKKVDWGRKPSNFSTPHNRRLLDGAQEELFPTASLVVVGYLLHPETSELLRLSFAPPCSKRPPWYFDVMHAQNVSRITDAPGVIELADRQHNKMTRLMLIRGDKQQEL